MNSYSLKKEGLPVKQQLEKEEAKTALATELVRQFVAVAHQDLQQVQSMLEAEPALLHAAANWGGGDWETALGAAAHVGRRDIALYLLEQGAHLDLFAAAMLGKLEVVKAIIEANPKAIHALGPHGIPLIRHAYMGGDSAREVAAYLEQLLAAEQAGTQKEDKKMIVVTNTIQIKKGHAHAVAERFSNPKGVHTMPGFIRMELLLTENTEENDELKVVTTWENRESFEGWVNSDSFKQAHAHRKPSPEQGGERPAQGSGEGPIMLGSKLSTYQVLFTKEPEKV